MDSKLSSLYNEIGTWSKSAFPDADSIAHMKKAIAEAHEVIDNPSDITEYADCLIAIFAAAYKQNIELPELLTSIQSKLSLNKKRTWLKQSDGTYQHVK